MRFSLDAQYPSQSSLFGLNETCLNLLVHISKWIILNVSVVYHVYQTYISNVLGVYQKISSVSKSIRCIKCINQMYQMYQEVSSVSRGVLGVSTCIRCIKRILVTRAFVTFYLLMCGLSFVFAIFANNKMCVLWT